jgi:hypothetical protein
VSHPLDAAEPRDRSDTAGNERLTALAGALLFVLLAVEGLTLVDLRPMFAVHAFVGVMLAGPIAVKLGSTGYRFVRYYTGNAGYRRKGPPRPVMRLLAPPLILATLTLLGSGIALLSVDPAAPGLLLFVHQASFVVWLVLAALHVLVYLWRVPRLLADDWSRPRRRRGGAGIRVLLSATGVLAGALAAALLLPHAQPWIQWLTTRNGG